MKKNGDDQAVLLIEPDWIDAQLAQNLLKEAGIPCILRTSNDTPLEFGLEGAPHLKRNDLMVPTALLAEAKAALARAWDDFSDGTERPI